MKKVVSAFILVLTLACFSVVGVYAAVVEKPVIEAEMPDCYREIGNGSIVLFANATVPDGGTVRYQWYCRYREYGDDPCYFWCGKRHLSGA